MKKVQGFHRSHVRMTCSMTATVSGVLRAYILGCKCTVLTDHSDCTSLLNTPHPLAKLARWAMIIQEMDLHIQHRPGKSNASADAFSRNPLIYSPTVYTEFACNTRLGAQKLCKLYVNRFNYATTVVAE